jgi:hypothetical protein
MEPFDPPADAVPAIARTMLVASKVYLVMRAMLVRTAAECKPSGSFSACSLPSSSSPI